MITSGAPKEHLIALMKQLVPTYRDPDSVNAEAIQRRTVGEIDPDCFDEEEPDFAPPENSTSSRMYLGV